MEACDQLNLNLISLKKAPNLYKLNEPSKKLVDDMDDRYFYTYIGKGTRLRNKAVILRKYPFLAKELNDTLRYTKFPLDYNITTKLLAEAIKNTSFKTSNYSLDQDVARIIGGELKDENGEFIEYTGCAKVSNYREELSYKDFEKNPYYYKRQDTELLWTQTLAAVQFAHDVMTFTNACEEYGIIYNTKCSQEDEPVYTGEYISPVPTKVDPWTRTWSSRQLEEIAKTTWCIEQGYRNYIYSKDICTNTLNR
jgi:hypothetical protein